MSNTIEQGLMRYLASLGSTRGRTFGIRDFNSQVMTHLFTEEERSGLQVALASMVEAGILEVASPTEYAVTAKGEAALRSWHAGSRSSA